MPDESRDEQLNTGVRLSGQDPDVRESQNWLEENGIEILKCGTCLDCFDPREKQ